jgi:hypothetical protein
MERIGRSVEAEAKLAAEEERRIEAEKEQQCNAEGRKKPGEPAAPPSDQPDPKAQRNFTDPESRIMKSKEGFVQAYNAQAAVDAGGGVQRGEQVDGAVPEVVVAAPLGDTGDHRQHRRGPFQRLVIRGNDLHLGRLCW